MRLPWYLVVFVFAGCVSESTVYQWNLSPHYISPYVSSLPEAERDQIARMMAHGTSQPIICMCEAKNPKFRGELYVYTGYHGGHDRGDFGYFALKRAAGLWQIIEGGTDLDPLFVCVSCKE